MLDDSEFSSVEAIYTWWLVLVLCIFSPVVKGALSRRHWACRQ
jgi:hypothetical protein